MFSKLHVRIDMLFNKSKNAELQLFHNTFNKILLGQLGFKPGRNLEGWSGAAGRAADSNRHQKLLLFP